MASITSPIDGNGGPAAAAAEGATTPMAAGFPAGVQTPDSLAAVQSGIATQYWDECLALPAGPGSLWLFVDGSWRAHGSPTASTKCMVQRAFLGTDSVVRVWYDGGTVVGLVVSGS
jgi:hypothetical protein